MSTYQRGFTLFELLATVIMAFTITIWATSMFSDYIHRAKVAHAIGDIGEIHMRVQMYDAAHRSYPASLAEVNLDGQLDPWGNPYQYLSFDNVNGNGPKRKDHAQVPVNTNYDIYSVGPDGKTATPFTSIAGRDDIVMAGDGTFFGDVGDYNEGN